MQDYCLLVAHAVFAIVIKRLKDKSLSDDKQPSIIRQPKQLLSTLSS